jgi:hypothetical protein
MAKPPPNTNIFPVKILKHKNPDKTKGLKRNLPVEGMQIMEINFESQQW